MKRISYFIAVILCLSITLPRVVFGFNKLDKGTNTKVVLSMKPKLTADLSEKLIKDGLILDMVNFEVDDDSFYVNYMDGTKEDSSLRNLYNINKIKDYLLTISKDINQDLESHIQSERGEMVFLWAQKAQEIMEDMKDRQKLVNIAQDIFVDYQFDFSMDASEVAGSMRGSIQQMFNMVKVDLYRGTNYIEEDGYQSGWHDSESGQFYGDNKQQYCQGPDGIHRQDSNGNGVPDSDEENDTAGQGSDSGLAGNGITHERPDRSGRYHLIATAIEFMNSYEFRALQQSYIDGNLTAEGFKQAVNAAVMSTAFKTMK
jgi:hypothetical protein